MRVFSLTRTARYGVALLSVAIAASLRFAIDPILGEVWPLLFFFIPVILAAWYGGLGPGLLATTLSLLLGDYLFIAPRYSILRYDYNKDMVSLVLVGLYGATVSLLADRLRKSIKVEIESKERYRAFIEHSSEAIWRFEFEQPIPVTLSEDEQIEMLYRFGYLAECNDATAKMYGYDSADQIVGARVGDLLVRSDPRNIAFLRALRRAGYRMTDVETREVDRHGNTKYFLNNLVGIEENGVIPQVWGTQRDITDQKRIEVALRESEERLKRITDATQDALWEIDLQTKLLWWSEGARPLFGHSPGELAPGLEDWYNGIHPEDVDRVRSKFEKFMRSGDPDWADEYRFRRADGSYVYISDQGQPFYDESGIPTRIAGAMSDITERKRAEDALRQSEERLRLAANAANFGTYDLDFATGRQYLSPEIMGIFCLPDDANVDFEQLLDLIDPSERERVAQALWASFDPHGQGGFEIEYQIIPAYGSKRWVLVKGRTLFAGAGDKRHAVRATGAILDISERKLAEMALRDNEERYRLLTELSPDGVVITDLDGTIHLVNQSMLRMLEATAEHAVGRNIFDLLAPEYLDYRERMKDLITNDLPVNQIEIAFQSKDGRNLPVAVNAVRFEWKGQPYVQIVIHDISRRKRAEAERERLLEEIEAERDRLTQILEQMPVGVSIAEAPAGRLLFHNREAERLLRHPLLKSDNYHEYVQYGALHEDGRRYGPEEYPAARSLLSGEVVKDDETRYQRGDGTETIFSVNSAPIRDQQGRIVSIVTTFVDIAERKLAEQALRESEERFAKAFRASPDVLVITRLSDKAILEVNESWTELFGHDRDEVIGKRWDLFDLLADPADRDRAMMILKENNRIRDFEMTVKRKSGEMRLVTISGEWLELHGARCFLTIVHDITERKQAEEALRKSDEQARRQLAQIEVIYDTAPVGLCFVGPDLRCLSINERLAEINGKSVEEHLGRTVREALPEEADEIEPIFQRVIKTGEPALNIERSMETSVQPGIVRHFIDSYYPIKNGDGRVLGVNVVVVEITERKKIEEERERLFRQEKAAREEAEAASRMKDEFLATISHELRTPLTAILGWAHMLTGGSLTDHQARHAAEVIAKSAQSQTRLIDDILDTSRIITGRLKLDARPVQIERVFKAAVDVVRPSAEVKGVALCAMIDAREGVVFGDGGRLQQAIWNLLSNAVKFTNEGGRIEARLGRAENQIDITVSDTGIGIDPQFLPHVFERFRQADSAYTRKYGGLGLGLAIVRHIVEMHGGVVSALSPGRGRGATFKILLPIVSPSRLPLQDSPHLEPDAPQIQLRKGSAEFKRLDGVRVMLVEDNPDTLDMLKFVFDECGAEVIATDSVGGALEALERFSPDALVSDLAMPDQDGYDLIRHVRLREPERGGNIPAVAVTAYASAEDRVRALAAGFHMHVAKPIDPEELIAVVASLTGHIH